MSIGPNRYHGQSSQQEMSRGDWQQCWEQGKTFFHKEFKHPSLVKYIDSLFNGKEAAKVFVPMCGKSLDIKWFYDLGHTVIGVEGAQLGIEQFFQEHHIEYTIEPADSIKGHLYQSLDKKVRLYCCDIFDFSSLIEGEFDAIWDRGAFGAVNHTDRLRYSVLIQSLMSPNCRCLVNTFNYDESQFAGPPRCVSDEVHQDLFGVKCHVELLGTIDMLTPEKAALGIDRFEEQIRLIRPK